MIKIENVTKRFDGYAALDHFSLTVPKGAIYGLMGLNGAEKPPLSSIFPAFWSRMRAPSPSTIRKLRATKP